MEILIKNCSFQSTPTKRCPLPTSARYGHALVCLAQRAFLVWVKTCSSVVLVKLPCYCLENELKKHAEADTGAKR